MHIVNNVDFLVVNSVVVVQLDHVYFKHLSTECRSILSADMATDTRPIYRPTLGRFVGRVSVDMLF